MCVSFDRDSLSHTRPAGKRMNTQEQEQEREMVLLFCHVFLYLMNCSWNVRFVSSYEVSQQERKVAK